MTKVAGFKVSQLSSVVGRWSFTVSNESRAILFVAVALGIRKMLHEFVVNGITNFRDGQCRYSAQVINEN